MIDLHEVFKNSLLSEVVLELRFPIRLKIPEKIADFQEKIINEFPKLEEGFLTKFALVTNETPPPPIDTVKVWEFKNLETQTSCKIVRNRFSIISNSYKSWEEHNSKKGFRDIVESTLNSFLETYQIKNFDRIGLRYINKVEIEEKTTSWLKKFFIPLFNIEKYPIESLNENLVRLIIEKQDQIHIILLSTFITENNKDYYILDFDAFLNNLEDNALMEKADQLHEEILREFHSLITDNCRIKMRGEL